MKPSEFVKNFNKNIEKVQMYKETPNVTESKCKICGERMGQMDIFEHSLKELDKKFIDKKRFEKAIEKKIEYWKNFLKGKGYKNGSLNATRIYVVIEDFTKLKKELKL